MPNYVKKIVPGDDFFFRDHESWHLIGIVLIRSLIILIMIVDKKPKEAEEKEWENPMAPEKTSDDRDKEQLLRQYKEAKRRKDNLTEADDSENKTEHQDI